jgi:hypothetical protein
MLKRRGRTVLWCPTCMLPQPRSYTFAASSYRGQITPYTATEEVMLRPASRETGNPLSLFPLRDLDTKTFLAILITIMAAGENFLGPLTAALTLHQSCSDELNKFYRVDESTSPYIEQGSPEMSTCFPNGYGKYRSDYYSPGVCPEGFTVACSRLTTLESFTETIQTCCPTSVSYHTHCLEI